MTPGAARTGPPKTAMPTLSRVGRGVRLPPGGRTPGHQGDIMTMDVRDRAPAPAVRGRTLTLDEAARRRAAARVLAMRRARRDARVRAARVRRALLG